MPGRRRWIGSEHPVTKVVDEIVEIFRGIGFTVAVGPEIETDWYNFTALNFPPDHPAMDMHDTLYVDAPPVAGEQGGRLLLRTHTSPVQIRTMLESPPPVRVIIPGLVYRNDPFDASHAPAFSQIEGLAVDEGISFVDLKATLVHFAHTFFSPSTKVRFRPSFFPFTEPSAEMDVECQLCHGSGCPACKGTGWMEILGCGMVHPAVFEHSGLDAERYTGWAFGMGPAPDRHAAIRHSGYPSALRGRHEVSGAVCSGGAAGQRGSGTVNVSLRWLEEFLRRPLDVKDVTERLAMLGAPVDTVEPLHTDLQRHHHRPGRGCAAPSQRRSAPGLCRQ